MWTGRAALHAQRERDNRAARRRTVGPPINNVPGMRVRRRPPQVEREQRERRHGQSGAPEVAANFGQQPVMIVGALRGAAKRRGRLRMVARGNRRFGGRMSRTAEEASVHGRRADKRQQEKARYDPHAAHVRILPQRLFARRCAHAFSCARQPVNCLKWQHKSSESESNRHCYNPCMFPTFRAMGAGAAIVLGLSSTAAAQLTVAAASDLQMVMPTIAERFERSGGDAVRVVYGSSGQFVAQIQQKAPFDVFLSADEDLVERLVESGDAERATIVRYATGRLALWSRRDRGLNLAAGLNALLDPGVRTVAIANPAHAPYGRAAVDALRRAGLYERLRPRLVMGENVAQALQFAQTGNADVSIVALSLVSSPPLRGLGSMVELPQAAHAPIRQAGVVISRSPHGAAGRRFLAFLGSPDVVALLRQAGFGVVP